MQPKPMRPTEEIQRLQRRCDRLEREVAELSGLWGVVGRMQKTIEQLQAIAECGDRPAPIFLRWQEEREEGCLVARAAFGKYRLDVVNGSGGVSWEIRKGSKIMDCGCVGCHFAMAQDEAEQALRRLVQAGMGE